MFFQQQMSLNDAMNTLPNTDLILIYIKPYLIITSNFDHAEIYYVLNLYISYLYE